MTTKTDEQERAAFERHWRDFYRLGTKLARINGRYHSMAVQCAWEAWQARAAVEADRQGRMPSDEELLKWAGEEQFFLFCSEEEFLDIAKTVLRHYLYGSGQPVVSGKPVGYALIEGGKAVAFFNEIPADGHYDASAYVPLGVVGAPAQPSGYAYRYPDGIRFNDGREVNGCKPTETLSYWFGAAPVAQEPAGEVFTMEPLDGSGDVKSHALLTKDLPAGTKLYAAPIAAQPVGGLDKSALEAAERRGYARAEAENVGFRADAGRVGWLESLCTFDVTTRLDNTVEIADADGEIYGTGTTLRDAIDAGRKQS